MAESQESSNAGKTVKDAEETGEKEDWDAPAEKGPEAEGTDQSSTQSTSEWLAGLMKNSMKGMFSSEEPKPEQLLEEVSFEGVVRYIRQNKCKKIITMAGAGISTSAGIPDFRSPGTGLYDNLQKYNLPSPMSIFDINFFRENPEPFFALAKELYPGVFKPTPCHYFLRMLHDKGLLLRHFTQNIDTLERVAGLPADMIVEAHGTFATAHCIQCQEAYTQDWVKEKVFADEVPKCTNKDCGGLVKPDIVFFGEKLPYRFFTCTKEDLPACDLLIILGTSLVVQPFASLTDRVPRTTPRLYINLEKGETGGDPIMTMLMGGVSGFMFDAEDNYRDIFWQGTCDDGCQELASQLGWGEELKALVAQEHARIDKEVSQKKPDQAKSSGKSAASQAEESDQKTPPTTVDSKAGSPKQRTDKAGNL